MMKENPTRRFAALLLLVVMIVFMGTVALSSAAIAINKAPCPPEICCLPTSFNFTATEGGPNPVSQSLWIGNCGDGTLEWSVSDDTDWLELSPTGGTSTGAMGEVTLSVDITGMSPGSYSATITIEDPGATNSPQTVPVSLTIEAPPGPPEICYLPTSFNFTATEGGPNPVSQSLWIGNCGDGTLEWSVNDDTDWLELSPTGGTSTGAMGEVTLSVDITGMSPGSYSATITIEDPAATNSPQTVPVSLTIEAPPGPPEICCLPTSFNFTATEGEGNPSDQTLGIWNCGCGTLEWSVSDDATWLTLDPDTGSSVVETDYITLSVDITGMSAGSYSAIITIEDPAATNSPQTVPVSLTIRTAGGRGGGGGGGGPVCTETFVVDFLGEITRGPMQPNGRLCEDLEAPCPDAMHLLEMRKDTRTVDSEGGVVRRIEITEATAPSLPPDTVLVGSAYEFSPSGITFDRSISLTLSYPVGELPADTLSVAMAYYSEGSGWTVQEAESSQVAEIGSLTSLIDHFSIFAIIAEVPPPELTVADLVVSPEEVSPGENVTISVLVANTGGSTGSVSVVLRVGGEVEDTVEVILAPGASETITFSVTRDEADTYGVTVNGLSGSFTVTEASFPWWAVGLGAGLGAFLLAVGASYVWVWRPRMVVA